MKIYDDPSDLNAKATHLCEKLLRDHLWVLTSRNGSNGSKYWTKPLAKSTFVIGNLALPGVRYCSIPAYWDDVDKELDPDDATIYHTPISVWYKEVLYPLELRDTSELFAENADLWWED